MPALVSHRVLTGGHRHAPAARPHLLEAAMRDTFRPHRIRRAAVTTALLIALAGALTVVLARPGLPDAWWPQTGNAFASSPSTPQPDHTAHALPDRATTTAADTSSDACDLIVGPAKAYCERGTTDPDTTDTVHRAPGWLGLLLAAPALAGVLVLLRRTRRSR
ncbi:hypothetical protein ACFRAO_43010 [Streptomyces sp. NPDC056656]|uniref:hypothetical protein n=1 Tax=Streptomyces sp. NPDC056656 TaxID=3345895 RepID=UPI0036C02F79